MLLTTKNQTNSTLLKKENTSNKIYFYVKIFLKYHNF